jgi:L-xylulokinase
LASQPVAILRWIKDNEPENYQSIRWVFAVKDYIRFRLTGEAYAEITDCSGSNLLDLSNTTFDREAFSWFGIEEMYDCLPPLRNSMDICGTVSREVAELTGLPQGIPVAGGMFDIDACCIAMNVVDSDNLCVIAGTWSINEYIARRPVLNHTVMMNSLYCMDGYYLVEESSPTSAGNLEWYIQMYMGGEHQKAEKEGLTIYQYCDRLVESVDPSDDEIIFLPYLYGSNYNPSAKACFLGLDSHHTQAHVVRAIFEGVVFCHMVHLEKLLLNKSDFKSIRLSGGAANSAVWVQMFADVTGYPVQVVQVKELGALGCAMVAAVACGDQQDIESASQSMTTLGKSYLPQENSAIYKKKFARYKAFSENLEKFWN